MAQFVCFVDYINNFIALNSYLIYIHAVFQKFMTQYGHETPEHHD